MGIKTDEQLGWKIPPKQGCQRRDGMGLWIWESTEMTMTYHDNITAEAGKTKKWWTSTRLATSKFQIAGHPESYGLLAACFHGKGDMQKELVTWARYVAIFHPSEIIRITSFFLRWTQHHFKGCCSYWILGTLRWEISRQLFATGLSFSGGTKCNKEFQDRDWAQFQWAKWKYLFHHYRDPISQLMGYRQGWVTYLNRNIACFEGIREPESWVEMRGVR